jgi:hypothetical protein
VREFNHALHPGDTAKTRIPLADATAIGFASPLITIALARADPEETGAHLSLSAVAVGFVGVIVTLVPHFEPAHYVGVAAGAAALGRCSRSPPPRHGAARLGKASAVAPNVLDRAYAAPVPNVHGLQTSTTNRFSFAAPAFQIRVPARQGRTGTIQVPRGGEIGYSRFVAQILKKSR